MVRPGKEGETKMIPQYWDTDAGEIRKLRQLYDETAKMLKNDFKLDLPMERTEVLFLTSQSCDRLESKFPENRAAIQEIKEIYYSEEKGVITPELKGDCLAYILAIPVRESIDDPVYRTDLVGNIAAELSRVWMLTKTAMGNRLEKSLYDFAKSKDCLDREIEHANKALEHAGMRERYPCFESDNLSALKLASDSINERIKDYLDLQKQDKQFYDLQKNRNSRMLADKRPHEPGSLHEYCFEEVRKEQIAEEKDLMGRVELNTEKSAQYQEILCLDNKISDITKVYSRLDKQAQVLLTSTTNIREDWAEYIRLQAKLQYSNQIQKQIGFQPARKCLRNISGTFTPFYKLKNHDKALALASRVTSDRQLWAADVFNNIKEVFKGWSKKKTQQ